MKSHRSTQGLWVNVRQKTNARALKSMTAVFGSLLILASYLACGVADPEVDDTTVATVDVTPATAGVVVGESVQLTVTLRDAAGNALSGQSVSWTSSDVLIAAVSTNGTVTGVAVGTVAVRATSSGVSDSAVITVSAVPVDSIQVTPISATITVGGTVQLHDSLWDNGDNLLTGRVVEWSSSDSSVVTVDNAGLASGVAAGAAYVRATSEGLSDSALVTVSAVPVATVQLNLAAAEVMVGNTVQLTATVRDAGGGVLTGRIATWTSNDSSTATVDNDGLVTGVQAGSAVISVTCEGQSDSAAITVSLVPVGSVSIAPDSTEVTIGGTVQLAATVRDSVGNVLSGRIVEWSSSDSATVTVSGSGLATGVAVGSATIIASSGGKSDSATVIVADVPVSTIEVTPSDIDVYVGGTNQLSAVVRDSAGNALSGRSITWATRDMATATVDSTGQVLGVAVGSTTIVATCEGQSDSASVSVVEVPVSSVELTPSNPSVTVGGSVQLTATARDSAGSALTGRTTEWGSLDSSIATVSGTGLVSGVAAGSTTIIATIESHADSVTVTVSSTSTGLTNECASPQPGWIWCDDFDEDRLSNYYEYDNSGGDFIRVAGIGAEGSTGMRAQFSNGQVSAGALHLAIGLTPQSYFDPVDDGTTIYRDIYWRVYLKHEDDWTGGGGNKLSRAFSFASTTSWAQAMIAHVWAGGPPNEDYLFIDPASGTDTDGNLVTTTYNDFANLRWLGAVRGNTPLFDDSNVGQWYCIEAHAKLNDAGESNGVFELWIDDNLEAARSDLNFLGSFSAYGINAVFLENYWNNGSPQEQERYFDNFVVSTQRIGCP